MSKLENLTTVCMRKEGYGEVRFVFDKLRQLGKCARSGSGNWIVFGCFKYRTDDILETYRYYKKYGYKIVCVW